MVNGWDGRRVDRDGRKSRVKLNSEYHVTSSNLNLIAGSTHSFPRLPTGSRDLPCVYESPILIFIIMFPMKVKWLCLVSYFWYDDGSFIVPSSWWAYKPSWNTSGLIAKWTVGINSMESGAELFSWRMARSVDHVFNLGSKDYGRISLDDVPTNMVTWMIWLKPPDLLVVE